MANREDSLKRLRDKFKRIEKALVVNENNWGADRWERIQKEKARKEKAIKERITMIEDSKRGRMSPSELSRGQNKLERDLALRKRFRQSGRREIEEDLLKKDDGTFQGFLNNFPTLRSQDNIVGRQVAKQKQEAALEAAKDDRVKVTKENAEAMQRGVDPELASAAKTAAYENLAGTENDLENYREEAGKRAYEKDRYEKLAGTETQLEDYREEAGKKAYEKDRYARQFGEYKREDEPKEEEGFLSSLARKGGETIDDVKDYFSGATAEKEGAEAAYAPRNEVDPGLKKAAGKNIDEWVAHTKNNPEDVTTNRRKKQMEDMSKRLNLSGISDRVAAEEEGRGLEKSFNPEGGSPDYDPSYAASLDLGDVENQISEGMGKDEEVRAVNEDLKGLSPIAQLDEDEQKEVLKEVAKASPDGKQSEEYLAAKEDTGDYIRYADGKFVLNKRAIRQDFQRKRNMDMLKDIPVANRAAMMASWGYIDSDDLSLAQKQSAKEIKEMSLLDLKLNKAKTDAEKAKNSLSDEDKVSFNLAQRGMQDAFTKGDYEAAEMYADQIKKIVPTYDNSSFTKLAEKRIQKNKEVTPMKLFKKYGLKDGIGYYKSRDSIVKTLSTLKEKGSGGLDALLGTAAPNGNGTYADLLKNHGIYSWDKIAQDIVQGRPPAGVPKQYLKDEESYMGWALPEIKSKLLSEMYGPLHGEIEAFHSPKMIKDRAVKRFKSTKDYSNPLGVSAEKVTPKKPAEVIKKVEASKSKKSASIEALNYQDKGVLSTRKQRVKETTNTIKKLEKELAGIKGSLNSSQIKTKQKRIDSFKNDLKKYEKLVIDKEAEAEAKHTNAEKIKGMKEYNKKRKAAGFPWLRKADYIRLKEEGKL